jgi:hypothetical protein
MVEPDQHEPALCDLIHPFRRDVGATNGRDETIEGRLFHCSLETIPSQNPDALIAIP